MFEIVRRAAGAGDVEAAGRGGFPGGISCLRPEVETHSGAKGVHLAIGITIAFAFIVFMKITTVFATNGDLSPFMAVLLPQIIFGVAAGYLIYKAPK